MSVNGRIAGSAAQDGSSAEKGDLNNSLGEMKLNGEIAQEVLLQQTVIKRRMIKQEHAMMNDVVVIHTFMEIQVITFNGTLKTFITRFTDICNFNLVVNRPAPTLLLENSQGLDMLASAELQLPDAESELPKAELGGNENDYSYQGGRVVIREVLSPATSQSKDQKQGSSLQMVNPMDVFGLKIKTEEKPTCSPPNHKCLICGREFSSRCMLSRHLKIHGGGLWKCSIGNCVADFNNPTSLTKHQQEQHGRKTFYRKSKRASQ